MALLISGASGSLLPAHLIPLLLRYGNLDSLHLVMTPAACQVAAHELGPLFSSPRGFIKQLDLAEEESSLVAIWDDSDLQAPIASGSYLLEGVIVLPCSSGMAASVAQGISRGLAQRVGDVALKQQWPLILGIRETPMSQILLKNLLKLSRAGAIIMPPIPAFYVLGPDNRGLEDFVSAYCIRLLDLVGIHLEAADLRWGQ